MLGAEVGSLSFPLGKGKGSVVVKEEVQDEEAIRRWLDRLPRKVEWCGERLPALAAKVLGELLRAERQTPSAEMAATSTVGMAATTFSFSSLDRILGAIAATHRVSSFSVS